MASGYPTKFQKRTLWNAATGLSIVVLAALLVGLVWLSGTIFGYLQPVLVPLAVAGIIAYLLDPLVTWMQGRGLSRLRAVIVTFCGFVLALCIAALLILPPVFDQVGELAADSESSNTSMVEFYENARENPVVNYLAGWALAPHEEFEDEFPGGNGPPRKKAAAPAPDTGDAQPGENGEGTPDSGGAPGPSETPAATLPPAEAVDNGEAEDLIPVPFTKTRIGHWLKTNVSPSAIFEATMAGSGKVLGVLGYLIGFAMVPIYLYFFLKESSSIKTHWHEYVPLRASKFKDEVVDCLSEINGYILAFFRGQVLVAFIDGFLIGLALMIFQVPYALVIGFAMAILGVIPFVGNILCLIPACIIAWVHWSGSEPNHQWLGDNPLAYVGVVVAIFVVAQQINSLVTAPKIVGDSVGLHPMTVIFSMLFWSIPLGGFLGALLAVPLTASVKVLIRRYVWERKLMDEPEEEPEPA